MTSNVSATYPYVILITFIHKMVVYFLSVCPSNFCVVQIAKLHTIKCEMMHRQYKIDRGMTVHKRRMLSYYKSLSVQFIGYIRN